MREAARNLSSGTTRGLLALVAFVALAGGIAVIETRTVVDLAQRAMAYRESGAAISVVSMPHAIDGAQCDALSSLPGVVSSGAIRTGSEVTLAALPSRPFQAYEATPGAADVLHLARTGDSAAGLWLSGDVIATLGRLDDGVPMADGSTARLGGTYPYPNDGRDPLLAYAIIVPVPAAGLFDACWVEVWPDPSVATAVLTLPVSPGASASDSDAAVPQVRQLNTTMGSSFDTEATLGVAPGWLLRTAAVGVGFALALGLIRARRLELASAAHAGLSQATLAWMLLIEACGWLVPACAATAAAIWWAAAIGNPADAWPACQPGVVALVLAASAALGGTLVGALSIKERHLFRYFKNR